MDPAPDDVSFQDAVGDVKRLPERPVVAPAPRPRARAAFRRADERRVLAESLELGPGEWLLEAGDELQVRRDDGEGAEAREALRESPETVGTPAIVVTEQNVHAGEPLIILEARMPM